MAAMGHARRAKIAAVVAGPVVVTIYLTSSNDMCPLGSENSVVTTDLAASFIGLNTPEQRRNRNREFPTRTGT